MRSIQQILRHSRYSLCIFPFVLKVQQLYISVISQYRRWDANSSLTEGQLPVSVTQQRKPLISCLKTSHSLSVTQVVSSLLCICQTASKAHSNAFRGLDTVTPSQDDTLQNFFFLYLDWGSIDLNAPICEFDTTRMIKWIGGGLHPPPTIRTKFPNNLTCITTHSSFSTLCPLSRFFPLGA